LSEDCSVAIIGSVKVEGLHSWQVSPTQALDIQQRLAVQVSRSNEVTTPHFIAGVDISVNKIQGIATGAVVVLQYPELILAACQGLTITPDLIMVDGQGVAHPRRMGLASHLGLFLDTPTIGCAKSLLCGRHNEPGDGPGSYAEIVNRGETIGVALRTRLGVKPIYVSIGHKINLQAAIYWVMNCCRSYRLPEPTRLAHLAAGGNLKLEKDIVEPEAGY